MTSGVIRSAERMTYPNVKQVTIGLAWNPPMRYRRSQLDIYRDLKELATAALIKRRKWAWQIDRFRFTELRRSLSLMNSGAWRSSCGASGTLLHHG